MQELKADYHPEPYWNEVAHRIAGREGVNVIAGDDEPFYRYKRKKFLTLLKSIPFSGKKVLEIGSGPGGNLKEVNAMNPSELTGADISQDMIDLARRNLQSARVNLVKTDGTTLPFSNNAFDLCFTATVLQHNTNESMLKQLVSEMCRVTSSEVYIFERIEHRIKGDELCIGRPVSYYSEIFRGHGFQLVTTNFINIQASYLVGGALRKLFNPIKRKEGEKLSFLTIFLQKISLPFTSFADKWLPIKRDLAMLHFKKINS